jgi:hypothetical protein
MHHQGIALPHIVQALVQPGTVSVSPGGIVREHAITSRAFQLSVRVLIPTRDAHIPETLTGRWHSLPGRGCTTKI